MWLWCSSPPQIQTVMVHSIALTSPPTTLPSKPRDNAAATRQMQIAMAILCLIAVTGAPKTATSRTRANVAVELWKTRAMRTATGCLHARTLAHKTPTTTVMAMVSAHQKTHALTRTPLGPQMPKAAASAIDVHARSSLAMLTLLPALRLPRPPQASTRRSGGPRHALST